MSVVVSGKPLGQRAYGSIGHILESRLGPGDHHVHEGQSAMCTRKAPKTKTVWAQTKLDGSCVAVAKLNGELVPLIRAGYPARTSKREMHHVFADWVDDNSARFRHVLAEGERVVGEWLAVAHGTRYDLRGREPFVPFDVMLRHTRLPLTHLGYRLGSWFPLPDSLPGPIEPEVAIDHLDHYGAERPEGVVYRVESAKGVDFLAKWVRPDKVDGELLEAEIWNWRPAAVSQ